MSAAIHPLRTAPFIGAYPATHALRESAPIRMIKAELHEIGKVINHAINHEGFKDETTKLLDHWHRNFSRSMGRDGNAERAIQEFIPQLQRILIDPLARVINPQTAAILDDRPLLGINDGRTYGFRSLTVFLSADGINPNRSPLRQNDETPFTTKPHPAAAYMVAWLKKFNSYISSPDTDEAFRQLMAEGRAAAIPSSLPLDRNREERIRRYVADQAQRERRDRVEQKESRQREEEVQAEAEDGEAAAFDLYEEIAQEMVSQFAQDRAEDAEATAAIMRDAENLERQIETLERELKELQERIDGVRGRISEIDRQNAELDRDIKEVQKAILERKNLGSRDSLSQLPS